MGPAIFLMAIMGCGEGEASCQPVRQLDTRYESQAACVAATEGALSRNLDVDYPVVVAQCHAASAPPRIAKAAEVRLPEPEATPHYPVKSSR